MEQRFSGRVTLILAVLLVGLAGIFWPITRLFDTSLPFSQKHNLKPGIDISGGTSLVYEIKPPSGNVPEDLSQGVADALKKRVDPDGVRNLIWRPQGPTRLEIQMPLSQGSEKATRLRMEFSKAQEELENTNVRPAEVRAALQNPNEQERAAMLERLAQGSAKRKELFGRLEKATKELAAAVAAGDAVRKVDAQDEVAEIEKGIVETNLAIPRLQAELELIQTAMEKAQKDGKASVVEEKKKEREKKIADLKAAVDFEVRRQAIDRFVRQFDEYATVKGKVGDAEDLKRLLRGSGLLEFHIAVTDPQVRTSAEERLRNEGPSARPGDSVRWYEVDRLDQVPQLDPVLYGDKYWALLYITPDESMVPREGGKSWGLKDADWRMDERTAQPIITFDFDAQGAVLFGDLTGRNVNRPLAIVLDDKLISAPNINHRIEGSGIIQGSFTKKEIDYMVRTLDAGSLPARLADEPISERTVGPTLGADNLRAGLVSCMIGVLVVAVFMIGYYYVSGVVAVVAVLMNTVMILGIMAMFQATFTLPGIAALVLTIGMAVDANVLIFERLREEQQRGLSLRLALRNAYDRAFSAIFDSNLTTIATSVILYIFGSEEIRGFGLTLAIGITTSMFTALYVTRTIFDLLIERGNIKKLGSLPLTFPNWDRMMQPKIDWMGKAPIFYSISAILIVTGLVAYFSKGRDAYDIEFVSGTSVQIELKETLPIQKVRDMLEAERFKTALPAAQVVTIGNTGRDYEIVTPNQDAVAVRGAVIQAMGNQLVIDVPSKFAQNGATFDEAMAGGVIQPVSDQPVSIDGFVAPDSIKHKGGAAFLLRDISPPLSPEKMRERLERTRLEPGRSIPFRELEIDTPQRDEKAPASTAVIFVSDPAIDYDRDSSIWQGELAQTYWKLINEGIGRPADLRRVTSINAQVAGDTKIDAIKAILFSTIFITVYVWLRFGNLKFGTATVVSLVHDVLMTLAFIGYSLYLGDTAFGQALLIEPFRMNLTLVAALLTVMGYSVNDTIVVFDRIRENRGKLGYVSRQVINDSINQTMSRTLLTGGSTIATLLFMYIMGGAGIHAFTFAMLVGILVGTYSSIAIAAPILLLGSKHAATATADRRPPPDQLSGQPLKGAPAGT